MAASVEQFRLRLEGEAIKSYGEDRKWWDGLPDWRKHWEVANTGMGSAFGYIRAARDSNNPHRAYDEETLRQIAERYGMTIEEFTRVLVAEREELRGRLSPDDWEIFFGTTTDIT